MKTYGPSAAIGVTLPTEDNRSAGNPGTIQASWTLTIINDDTGATVAGVTTTLHSLDNTHAVSQPWTAATAAGPTIAGSYRFILSGTDESNRTILTQSEVFQVTTSALPQVNVPAGQCADASAWMLLLASSSSDHTWDGAYVMGGFQNGVPFYLVSYSKYLWYDSTALRWQVGSGPWLSDGPTSITDGKFPWLVGWPSSITVRVADRPTDASITNDTLTALGTYGTAKTADVTGATATITGDLALITTNTNRCVVVIPSAFFIPVPVPPATSAQQVYGVDVYLKDADGIPQPATGDIKVNLYLADGVTSMNSRLCANSSAGTPGTPGTPYQYAPADSPSARYRAWVIAQSSDTPQPLYFQITYNSGDATPIAMAAGGAVDLVSTVTQASIQQIANAVGAGSNIAAGAAGGLPLSGTGTIANDLAAVGLPATSGYPQVNVPAGNCLDLITSQTFAATVQQGAPNTGSLGIYKYRTFGAGAYQWSNDTFYFVFVPWKCL